MADGSFLTFLFFLLIGLAADNAASPNFFDKIPHDKTYKYSKIYIKFGVFAMKPK